MVAFANSISLGRSRAVFRCCEAATTALVDGPADGTVL